MPQNSASDGEVLVEKHSDITLVTGESKMQLAQGMAIVRNQNKRLRCFAYAELETEDGKYTDTRLVRREKYAHIPHPVIKREYDFIRDGVLKITLSTDVFARGVFIRNNINGAKFSDNFFDLVPGAIKKHRLIRASMLQDIEKGKPCEVEAINGVVSEYGRKVGVPTPVNDRAVEIIRGIEEGKYKPSFDNLKLFDDVLKKK